MTTLLIRLSLLLVMVAPCAADSKNQPRAGTIIGPAGVSLPFKAVTIEYEYSGDTTGSETVHIDRFGQRKTVVTKTQTKFGGRSSSKNNIMIIDSDWVFYFDPVTKVGTKTKNNFKQFQDSFKKKSPASKKKLAKEAISAFGGEKSEKIHHVAGKECTLYKSSLGSNCLWNGIDLEAEVKLGELRFVKRAIRIDLNNEISESKFLVPTDVKLTEKAAPNLHDLAEKAKLIGENLKKLNR